MLDRAKRPATVVLLLLSMLLGPDDGGDSTAVPSPPAIALVAGCWTGTPTPAESAGLGSAMGGGGAPAPATGGWTATASGSGLQPGEPIVLTWGIVPDGTPILSSGFGEPVAPSNLVATLDGLFGAGVWQSHFDAVLERWGELSGVSYVFEPADDGAPVGPSSASGVLGVRADIRIGGKNIDGNTGFNLLAFNYFPAGGGDMVLDTTNGAFFTSVPGPANDALSFRNVISHEHGHGLGLQHVCPIDFSKLMEPAVSTLYDGPQHHDVRTIQRLYGDDAEPNDSVVEATNLGFLVPGTPVTRTGLSLDDDADEDVFRFEVDDLRTVEVTLAPVGFSYTQGPEGLGSCPAGAPVDSTALRDLAFDVLDATGAVLLSVDAAPAGQAETTTCFSLPDGASDYYVRVRGDLVDAIQLYDLTVEVRDGRLEVPAEFATIQNAIDAACGSETIVVGPGTWSGFSYGGKNLRIIARDGPTVTSIDSVVVFNGPEEPSARLEGFRLIPSSPTFSQIFTDGVVCLGGSSPTIIRCVFSGTDRPVGGGGVAALTGSAPTIINCVFDGCSAGPPAFSATTGGGAIFADNVPFASPSSATAINCTILNCSVQGGQGGGVFGNVTVVNSIVRDNTPDQLGGGASATFSNVSGGAAGLGNIDAVPQFVQNGGAANLADYRLVTNSPGTDAGDTSAVSGIPRDLENAPRVQGSAVDMGADEGPACLDGTGESLDMLGVDSFFVLPPCMGTFLPFAPFGPTDLLFVSAQPPVTTIFVFAQLYHRGAPPLGSQVSFPGVVHLDATAQLVAAGPSSIILGAPIMPGFSDFGVRFQAFAFDSTAANGLFQASRAIDVFLP